MISTSTEISPKVSVVMATYNGSAFLSMQLESVSNQTYSNIEIIISDDGSTDDSIKIINVFAQNDPRIKLYINENNSGFIKNFEKGCSLATGKFIALCDQDDYWHPDKIKQMVDAIGDAPMIYCNSFLCDAQLQQTGKKISDVANCQPFFSCIQQAVFCRIYGHATLFRKELFEASKPFLTVIPHDWWLSFIASVHGEIKYLDEPLVYYRQHATNLFGAVGGKKRKHHRQNKKEKKQREIMEIRTRMNAFYKACPGDLLFEKKILLQLAESYKNFSFSNNVRRMIIFFRHYKLLLGVKKRSLLRQYLFCLKMFFIIK